MRCCPGTLIPSKVVGGSEIVYAFGSFARGRQWFRISLIGFVRVFLVFNFAFVLILNNCPWISLIRFLVFNFALTGLCTAKRVG